jgi:hypothetical protein
LSLDPTATKQGRLFGKAIERAVLKPSSMRRKLHENPHPRHPRRRGNGHARR